MSIKELLDNRIKDIHLVSLLSGKFYDVKIEDFAEYGNPATDEVLAIKIRLVPMSPCPYSLLVNPGSLQKDYCIFEKWVLFTAEPSVEDLKKIFNIFIQKRSYERAYNLMNIIEKNV